MIILGRRFSKRPPDKISFVFGYRSSMSMKNKETWKFAHEQWGNIVCILGVALIPGSIVSMLLIMNSSTYTIDLVGVCICIAQILALTCSIIPVEYALKKNFDKDGNRK